MAIRLEAEGKTLCKGRQATGPEVDNETESIAPVYAEF